MSGKSLIYVTPNDTIDPPPSSELKRSREVPEPNVLSPPRLQKIPNNCQPLSKSSSPNGTTISTNPLDGIKIGYDIVEASLSWTLLFRDKCSETDVLQGVKHIGISYSVEIDTTLFSPIVISNSTYTFAMLNVCNMYIIHVYNQFKTHIVHHTIAFIDTLIYPARPPYRSRSTIQLYTYNMWFPVHLLLTLPCNVIS